MFDPLTSVILTPREIEMMVNEMFEAEARMVFFSRKLQNLYTHFDNRGEMIHFLKMMYYT